MGHPYGERVFEARMTVRKGLREVARALEVTPTYLSDIEQGRRNPPPEEKVRLHGQILGIDYDTLARLAQLSRKAVELAIPTQDSGLKERQELALALARNWEGLSEEMARSIHDLLGGVEDGSEG